jgi:hypothetical protein
MITPETIKLLTEFRDEIKDKRCRALLDAYIKKPDPQAIAEEALQLLSKALNHED